MIPLKDTTPRRSTPVVTLLLILANVIVFVHQVALPHFAAEAFIRTYGLVPAKISMALAGKRYTLEEAALPLFTCMFLHGGFLHIIGNMWFLWIFGGNVEDRLGALGYMFLYFLAGIVSGISQVAFSWGSHIPSIGASGAISGVLGAYIVFFPRSRILSLVPLFIIWFMARIPAFVFIGLWFVVQFLSGMASLQMPNSGGIAWWAHVGGFLIGFSLALTASARRRSRRADS